MNRRDLKVIAVVVGVVLAIVAVAVIGVLFAWSYNPSGDEPVGKVTTVPTIATTR